MISTLVLSDVGDEAWGAVLEDGQVVELHVENSRRPATAGNVYKGRISRVLPGMQSAFVDIGIDKDAFLHVADLPAVRGEEHPFEPEEAEAETEGPSADPERAASPERDPSSRARAPQPPIQDLLREGQEILVQVAKEPIAAKGARVTAQIALPGRALVYLPFHGKVFVSRRIEDQEERERVRELLESPECGGGIAGGWIIRTAGEAATLEDLQRDVAYLSRLWTAIQERDRRTGAPALLHQDLTLPERLLRDVVSEEFQDVIVDSDRLQDVVGSFMEQYLRGAAPRLSRAPRGWELFDRLGVHQEIERALRPRVWLRTGGSIVVNPTEALVAIDVNTGKYVGKDDFENTALRTNLEAVREVVRLLRLRDLGGIIVIDFIDMVDPDHREALSRSLSEELRRDRSRTKLLAMSDFGLVQLTRKRTRRSLDRALQTPCPTCGGGGRIRSATTLYYEIQRELARAASLAGGSGPALRLHPAAIQRIEAEGLRFRLPSEAAPGGAPPPVRIVPDGALSEESYEIVW